MAFLHQILWNTATAVGTRNIGRFVGSLSSAYANTAFYFDNSDGHADGVVALTIDDGLSRGGLETSLVADLMQLLERYEAKCTFFVCAKYLQGLSTEAAALVSSGNELGNHLGEDKFGYSKLPAADFEAELQATTSAIEEVPGAQVRWFRAPQGIYTNAMHEVCTRHDIRHAIGDAYCDDWAVSDAKWVARTLLKQAKAGSIIIMHMPEKGFREHTLQALELVLQGLSERGLKCTTLSDLSSKAQAITGKGRPRRPSSSSSTPRSSSSGAADHTSTQVPTRHVVLQ